MNDNHNSYVPLFDLGDVVTLCNDKDFKAVVVAIEFRIDGSKYYKLKWRSGRSFIEDWFMGAEILAIEKLREP